MMQPYLFLNYVIDILTKRHILKKDVPSIKLTSASSFSSRSRSILIRKNKANSVVMMQQFHWSCFSFLCVFVFVFVAIF